MKEDKWVEKKALKVNFLEIVLLCSLIKGDSCKTQNFILPSNATSHLYLRSSVGLTSLLERHGTFFSAYITTWPFPVSCRFSPIWQEQSACHSLPVSLTIHGLAHCGLWRSHITTWCQCGTSCLQPSSHIYTYMLMHFYKPHVIEH